ncbi:MAG TPA: ABC transporter substrate-binding protein [Methanophagales archaeon]|nr:ABC transporter substrate-binding protein [Methanophagales archaeon]
MKTKIVVLMGLALCTMLLMSPALASDAGTLVIYGNANEDDTIDMRDLTYVKLIFFGKKSETALADAKYDGKINPLDFIQIKLIIVGKEKELTVVDTVGRDVTIDKPLLRLAVLNWNTLEVMRSLKQEKEKITCVSKSTIGKEEFFPEFKDRPNAGNAWSPDIEKILALKPDAVFLYATHFETSCDDVQKKLEDAGITVIRFDCFKPEDYLDEVNKLGYILDKEAEAGDFGVFYVECLKGIKETVAEIPNDVRSQVYFEGFGEDYKIGGNGTALHQIIEMAGGKNIFGDISGYKVIDKEEVMLRDPEIIVKQGYARGKYGYNTDDITWLQDICAEITGRIELANVSAVKDERVYVIIKELTGGKHFIAATYMAKWFYPELFKDLDPKAIHQEYLTRFQGLDFDLDAHGVFVYPLL